MKLIKVTYKMLNKQLYAIQVYQDYSVKVVKVDNIVDYILRGDRKSIIPTF